MRAGAAAFAITLLGSLAAPAIAADPLEGESYSGRTGQGKPLSFDVSGNGARIKFLISTLKGSCANGTRFSIRVTQETTPFRVAIAGDGTFAGGGSLDRFHAAFDSDRFAISGRFRAGGHKATGTMRFVATDHDGVRCTTPRVSFSATG
jgi:hypothetical protein